MVKAKTLQVVWHSKEPVYSVDFHPNGQLATGGADKEVKVWEVERGSDGYPSVRHVSSLTAHLNTVNCVRFSPTGTHLATSGDAGEVLLWEPVDAAAAAARRGNLCEDEGEASWRRCAAFKGHSAGGDVMDLAWAPDGTALASGAIDNEAFLFVAAGRKRGDTAGRFKDHKHFVQGVAWDPAQQFVATQSADRTCRVYALKPPAGGRKNKVSQYLLPAGETARDFYCAHTLAKRAMPGEAAEGGKPASHPLFADERVNTFFRRPAWSPDGSLLVVPAGVYKAAPGGSELKTAYVYARGKWGSPIMHLPGHSKDVVVVRFCPVLFERDDGKAQQAGQQAEQQVQQQAEQQQAEQQQAEQQAEQPQDGSAAASGLPIDLPYKMVFAVATLDSVVLYNTQSALPLAVLGHLHYDSITDLAWSSDGQYLAISSRDCYCSIAAFDAGELGKPLPASQLPAHIAKRVASAQRMAAPVAMAAPAARTAAAPSAAKAAATPSTAKPATVAEAAAATAAEPASTARQQPEAAVASAPPVVAAAAPAAQRKRIQPEPVSAAPAAGAAGGSAAEAAAPQPGEQPAAKKARRITPETVGPAPAVVGDSQQGGLDLRSYPEPPASAKPVRRITAEPVGAPSGGPGSASGAQPAKPPRRITAEPIGPLPGAAPPSAAKSAGLPAESAVSGKLAKRITPTPLHTADSTGRPFSAAAAANQACAQPAPSEMSRDGCPPASARRITPVPVGAAQALPPGEERTASVAPKPSGIAALAAALGAQAAHQRQQ